MFVGACLRVGRGGRGGKEAVPSLLSARLFLHSQKHSLHVHTKKPWSPPRPARRTTRRTCWASARSAQRPIVPAVTSCRLCARAVHARSAPNTGRPARTPAPSPRNSAGSSSPALCVRGALSCHLECGRTMRPVSRASWTRTCGARCVFSNGQRAEHLPPAWSLLSLTPSVPIHPVRPRSPATRPTMHVSTPSPAAPHQAVKRR